MRFNVGKRVRVVNPHSGGCFEDGDIVTILQCGDEGLEVYGAISPHDGNMWFLDEDEVAEIACARCDGYKAVFYKDVNEAVFYKDLKNNAFIDGNGNMFVMIDGKEVAFRVNFCPCCGRKFEEI